MEATERTHVLNHLNTSRAKLLASVEGLTPEQWEFRPEEGRWSIASCLEHVVLVENRILNAVNKTLQAEPTPEKKAQAAEKETFLKNGSVLNRTSRFNAPEPVHPRNAWPGATQLLNEFENTRARTIEYVSSEEGDLRSHFFPHPVFGDLDCYQWLMLLPLHCERHLEQIEEIKSSPDFPRHQVISV